MKPPRETQISMHATTHGKATEVFAKGIAQRMSKRPLRAIGVALVLALLTGCNPPGVSAIRDVPGTSRDSVTHTVMLMWDLGRQLDSYGRSVGILPPTLDSITKSDQTRLVDVWRGRINYRVDGLTFELRSPGPDGLLKTPDDVVSIGMVGRNLPCETRNSSGTRRYEEIVAECSAEPPIILPLCPALIVRGNQEDELVTSRDSVLVTGRRLVRIARIVDGVGRERGGLPPSTRSIPGHPRINDVGIPDAWNRAIQYEALGRRFELRSAGPDGMFGTGDDIVVQSELGRTIPCAFATGEGERTCSSPPPECR